MTHQELKDKIKEHEEHFKEGLITVKELYYRCTEVVGKHGECFCGYEDTDQKWYFDIVLGEDDVICRIEITEEQANELGEYGCTAF